MTSYWARTAARAIETAAATIPESATLKERAKAIDAAYPFGPRRQASYETWMKARTAYLSQYGYVNKRYQKAAT